MSCGYSKSQALEWLFCSLASLPLSDGRALAHGGDRAVHLHLRGVLFSSNPRGDDEEGWISGRYSVFHDLESWRRYASAAGFVELTLYYRPDGAPHEQQPWLASVWRRLAP
jgi:hypothetical protein